MSESDYKLFFEAAPQPTWISDPGTGAMVAVNDAALRQYGYSRAEFLSLNAVDIESPEEIGIPGVAIHKRKDGSRFFAEAARSEARLGGRRVSVTSAADVGARVGAEQRMRASEAKFRTLFVTSPDAIALACEARFVLVNPAYAEMFQYETPEAMAGVPVLDVVAPAERRRVAEYIAARNVRGSAPQTYTSRGIRRDGTEFTVDVRTSQFVEDGKVYTMSVLRDVSRLQDAFDALARSRRSLEEAQRIASLGNWELDLSSGIIQWSDEIYRIFGLDPAGPKPSRELFYSRVHPHDRVFVREAADRAVDEHEPYDIDHRIVRPDGSERWVHEHAEVFREGGVATRLAGTVQDITTRRAAEQRLRLLESVAVSAQDGVVLWDGGERRRILWMNRSYCRLTGRRETDTEGEPVELLHYPKALGERNRIRAAMARGEAVRAEVAYKRPDGAELVAEVDIFPVVDRALAHWAAIVRDIGERRRLEAEFLQSQKMEAVGRLAGGVAHDFNNLLLIISGYAHMLREGCNPSDAMLEGINQIVDAAGRAAALTRQLLLFSRRHETRLAVVDLNKVVRGLEKMLGRVIGEDVQLRTRFAPNEAAIVADASKLEQVLMNLAVNARDAMPQGGVLSVVVDRPSGSEVRVTVSDTGHGMDEETRLRIFEPFFTTKGEDAGTGLGLSTAYAIVKQFGGDIAVITAPGAGATFEIVFPSASSGGPEAPPESAPAAHSGSASILLVEDDPGVRLLIASMLRRRGYTVREAAGAEDALPIVESPAALDLLLTDIVMPGMNGWDLAERTLERRPSLPVLYMSGYTDHAAIQDRRLERVQLLNKPFTIDALSAAIHEALGTKTMRAQ